MLKNFDEFLSNILSDLKVDLGDEFDRNFERKAFFDQPWPQTKMVNNKGSLMNRTGDLRKSIMLDIGSDGLEFYSSLPYAALHNQGGKLTVTVAMKKYFWAMYYELGEKSDQALAYKYMAFLKVGSEINIPQRQFIGQHPEVNKSIEMVVDNSVKDLEKEIFEQLKNIR